MSALLVVVVVVESSELTGQILPPGKRMTIFGRRRSHMPKMVLLMVVAEVDMVVEC